MSDTLMTINPDRMKEHTQSASDLVQARWKTLDDIKQAQKANAEANKNLALHAFYMLKAIYTLPNAPHLMLMPLHRTMWSRASFQSIDRYEPHGLWSCVVGMRHTLQAAAQDLCNVFDAQSWDAQSLTQRICGAKNQQGYLLLHAHDAMWHNEAGAATLWAEGDTDPMALRVKGHRTFVRSFHRHDVHGMKWGVLRPYAGYHREDRAWFYDDFDTTVDFAVALEADPDNPRKRPYAMPAGLTPATLFANP